MYRKLAFSLFVFFASNIQAIHSAHHHHNNEKLGYGEPCSPELSDSKVCDEQRNLECSTSMTPNVCACKTSSEYSQIEYYKEMGTCLHISGIADSFSCQTDGQCKSSSYGRYSRCSTEGRCECYDEQAKTELVNNICFLTQPILFGGRTSTMNSCSQDQDCQSSALGELSRCNLATTTCECFDKDSNGKQTAAPYQGICIFAKRLDEFCENDEECQVGGLVNAVCTNHPNYLSNKEKVCVCPPGVSCEGRSSATTTTAKIGFFSISILTLAIFH